MDEELRELLLGMVELEKRARAGLAGTAAGGDGYAARLAEVRKRNADSLKGVVDQRGWPGSSLVGHEGAQAAWLVAQHAAGTPEFQRKCLRLLKDAAARGEAEPAYVAYLEDSIRFHERRPQRYGTQFDWDENGELSPWTLEDPDHVDAYRKSVGLEPLAQRVERLRARRRAATEQPPQNLAHR